MYFVNTNACTNACTNERSYACNMYCNVLLYGEWHTTIVCQYLSRYKKLHNQAVALDIAGAYKEKEHLNLNILQGTY